MKLNEILAQVKQQPLLLIFASVLILLLFLCLWKRQQILSGYREWRIQRILRQLGCEQIRNLTCPDGLDGYYNIDRLALLKNSILVISYKPYSGNIYCAERISEWTQMVGKQSFKFENPLFELENQLTALRQLAGTNEIQGYLFFNHNAEFPKGHPASVMHPDNIPDRFLQGNSDEVRADIHAAWKLLGQYQPESSLTNAARVKT